MNLLRDLHFGVRLLLRTPVVTVAAILALALGIGANTTIFSLVDALMFRPMTVRDPDRVVRVYGKLRTGDMEALSYADYRDLAADTKTLAVMAASDARGFPLKDRDHILALNGEFVSTNYFSVVGIRPVLGRDFQPGEETPHGGETVAVIGYGLWQRYFGGDPKVLGKTFEIRGWPTTIIGVAPRNFEGMRGSAQVWVPAIRDTQRGFNDWDVFGRLKPGSTVAAAKAEMDVLLQRLSASYPKTNKHAGAIVEWERERLRGRMQGLIPLVLVGLVLLISCATVQNLLLARAEERQREMAIRAAIGASRRRLVLQMLIESVLLAALGTVGGLVLARSLIDYIPRLVPALSDTHFAIDERVLVFTACASCVSILVFGLVPALRGSQVNMVDALKATRHAPLPGLRVTLRDALAGFQVALSVVLLASSALLVRSLLNLNHVEAGFDRHGLVIQSVVTPRSVRESQFLTFYNTVLDQTRALPGVTHAAFATRVPLSDEGSGFKVRVYAEGVPLSPGDDAVPMRGMAVTSDYFNTIGTRLTVGRFFTQADEISNPTAVIVNQTLAHRFWPGQNPVGKQLRSGGPNGPEREVVGVVQDSKYVTLRDSPEPFVYFPLTALLWGEEFLIVRTGGSPDLLRQPVAHLLRQMNPDMPRLNPVTVDEHIAGSIWQDIAMAKVATGFGLLALVLTCVGIYGVLSYSVNRRTREIGVRLALGARPSSVLGQVVRHAMTTCAVGAAAGAVGAFVLSRFLRSFLFDVNPTEPFSFAIAVAIVFAVGFVSCAIPAHRASRVDPAITLRTE